MKCIHLSDLHLGKRVNGFSMLEDQDYILKQVLQIIDQEVPQVILLAGDIYDKPIPPAEAVSLFDWFLVELAARKVTVCIISGNHDSQERLSFGGRLMEGEGVHIARAFTGEQLPLRLEDEHGGLNIYMLPFVKPVHVKRVFPEAECESYHAALSLAVGSFAVNPEERNILMTHQFITGAQRCESEELWVGGAEQVDGGLFSDFDYVALGHLHGPQKVGRETVRYCGTPLKYSFSEVHHKKSVTVVSLGEKGVVTVGTVPLQPLRDMVELRGSYMELTAGDFYKAFDRQAYIKITLIDEEDVFDAMGKLRGIYPNLMTLVYDNKRTRSQGDITAPTVEGKTPISLFGELYQKQNNDELSSRQIAYLEKKMAGIWGGGV